jgi:hypothetical protein
MQFQEKSIALTLSEVVKLTGLPKSQIQNWTSGRPHWVIPSIAVGDGKGSRHLFALEDVYLLCFLNELREQGLSSAGMKRVVDFFRISIAGESKTVFKYFRSNVCWLSVSLTKMVLMINDEESSETAPNPRFLPPIQVNDFHDRHALQISVNIEKIRDEVNSRAKQAIK